MANKRTDTASKVIKASPETIYQAHLQPEAIAQWRPPQGMSARVYTFEPVEGGAFRMAFIYSNKEQDVKGKTSENEDVFKGKFLELVENEKIVELVEFESDDPAFAGEMKVNTLLKAVDGGTEVTVVCENVPEGISEEDHQAGILSSLNNLARFVE